jgi:hypothetical protein
MKNYKDYFAENNPCNLVNTFDVYKRMGKSIKRKLSDSVRTNSIASQEPQNDEDLRKD